MNNDTHFYHIGYKGNMDEIVEVKYSALYDSWLSNRFIDCIRNVRSLTSMGLKDAKNFVESFRGVDGFILTRFDEFYNYLVNNSTYVWIVDEDSGLRYYTRHFDPKMIHTPLLKLDSKSKDKFDRFANVVKELAEIMNRDPFETTYLILNAFNKD